jgi:hypothetical protein
MGNCTDYSKASAICLSICGERSTFATVLRAMKARDVPEDVARAAIWNLIDRGDLDLDTATMQVLTRRLRRSPSSSR